MRLLPPAFLALALTLAIPPSASGADVGPDRDVAAVKAVGERWRALYAANDFAAIPDLYTEDTLVMPRGRPTIAGREAMRKAVGGLAAGRRVAIDIDLREVVVEGDLAWSLADFTVTYTPPDASAPPKVESGRSLVIYRRDEDGAWRIHRDIDAPRPASAE